jgi:Na+-transporting methylmalonyl-CoA/oxaloacetate decarboxylase gamma subunit
MRTSLDFSLPIRPCFKGKEYMQKLIENAINLDWGYVMSTLIIRFVGVFVVLAILMVGMIALGKIVSWLVAKQEAKKARHREKEAQAARLAEAPERDVDEEEVVAAIGAALALIMESEQSAMASSAQVSTTAGSWAMAGRVAVMNGRLQGGSQRRPGSSRL